MRSGPYSMGDSTGDIRSRLEAVVGYGASGVLGDLGCLRGSFLTGHDVFGVVRCIDHAGGVDGRTDFGSWQNGGNCRGQIHAEDW